MSAGKFAKAVEMILFYKVYSVLDGAIYDLTEEYAIQKYNKHLHELNKEEINEIHIEIEN